VTNDKVPLKSIIAHSVIKKTVPEKSAVSA